MQIIPNTPYDTNSRAELRVFDKLKEAFVNDFAYTALHSLNLTKHHTKKFGEADFVLVTKFGIFVLEVKGGGVEYFDGRWSTQNSKGIHPIQDPFRQAETALHAIKDAIIESSKFPLSLTQTLPIGYGVIFPDSEWRHTGSEWDRKTVCDSKNFRNFENWLKSFFRYWQNKPRNNKQLSAEDISGLKRYLRPNFELLEPLYSSLERAEEKAVRLTEDQYKYLDSYSENTQILCSGGAGTGKTFMAAELARRLSSKGKNILFACKSNWLRRYLETRIESEYLTISTIDSVKVDKRRAGLDQFDILIVDEGQDLFGLDNIELLDSMIDGGFEEGEWYIFHDVNNQAGLFAETKMEVLDYLKSFKPALINLKTNCRNTLNILTTIHDRLNVDMGSEGTGIGPEIYEVKACDSESSKILEQRVDELLKSGVPPESITILSPLVYEQSSVNSLSMKLKNMIIKLDDYSVREFPVNGISFAEIKNFKGLENEVIIVIDLQDPIHLENVDEKVQHYVAMSRAKGLLCVIWTE